MASRAGRKREIYGPNKKTMGRVADRTFTTDPETGGEIPYICGQIERIQYYGSNQA